MDVRRGGDTLVLGGDVYTLELNSQPTSEVTIQLADVGSLVDVVFPPGGSVTFGPQGIYWEA